MRSCSRRQVAAGGRAAIDPVSGLRCRHLHRVAALVLVVLAAACSNALRFKVAFDQVSGLQAQAPVLWDGTAIGRVDGIRYTALGRFEVAVHVHENFRSAVTGASRFVVSDAPQGQGRVLEMLRVDEGGDPLADGAVIEGSTHAQVLSDTLGRHLEGMLQGLRGLPVDKWSREVQEEMARLGQELERASRETREKLRRDVLPRLEQELEALRRWLRDQGREEEMAPLERQFEELKRI